MQRAKQQVETYFHDKIELLYLLIKRIETQFFQLLKSLRSLALSYMQQRELQEIYLMKVF